MGTLNWTHGTHGRVSLGDAKYVSKTYRQVTLVHVCAFVMTNFFPRQIDHVDCL